jgi:hypothetical protein
MYSVYDDTIPGTVVHTLRPSLKFNHDLDYDTDEGNQQAISDNNSAYDNLMDLLSTDGFQPNACMPIFVSICDHAYNYSGYEPHLNIGIRFDVEQYEDEEETLYNDPMRVLLVEKTKDRIMQLVVEAGYAGVDDLTPGKVDRRVAVCHYTGGTDSLEYNEVNNAVVEIEATAIVPDNDGGPA